MTTIVSRGDRVSTPEPLNLDFMRGYLAAIGSHEIHGATCGCPQIAAYVPQLLDELERLTTPAPELDLDDLTASERVVAQLLLGSMSYADMARHRYVTANTIRTQVRSVYRKLGVARRAELREVLRGAA